MITAGYFGVPVSKSLSAAGFRDPKAESSQTSDLLSEKFGQGDLEIIFTVHCESGVASRAAQAVGAHLVQQLRGYPFVAGVSSAWTAPPTVAAELISRDHKTGLVVAGLSGDGTAAQRHGRELADHLAGERDGVAVTAGGPAVAYAEINRQAERDLLVTEGIAIPISLLVLIWVFGGLLAAVVPLGVGVLGVIGAVAILRLLALVTEVSTFALNLTVAMGLALAVDYSLLIVSRFRDERASGAGIDDALIRTMVTAGRTVLFSAMTVGLSMLALALYPMYFLKSFAFAGFAVVALTALAALLVAPAAIMLLGDRIDSWDVRRLGRRFARRPVVRQCPVERNFWCRTSKFAIRHAFAVGVGVTSLLLLLGAPFLHVRWGFTDDRMLPASASARRVGEQLRNDFPYNAAQSVTVVIPDLSGVTPAELTRFARDLSRKVERTSVSAPEGTYVAGVRVGPPSAPTAISGGSAFLTVSSNVSGDDGTQPIQLAWLHRVAGPNHKEVKFGGGAQVNVDNAAAIQSRLPYVLAVVAVATFLVIFMLTGSVVLPVKALVLNVVSLTATFGALVWIFQDGHLRGLGTTSTGSLVVHVPVLLFCVAYGLSMDYEVFLLARIREYWQTSDRESLADNDRSIALGVARTGRVVTAAALLMAISFAALMASSVAIMRMLGLGLTLAVVIDASLVRLMLVPAFMHGLGPANWWAPRRVARWHDRLRFSEADVSKPPQPTPENSTAEQSHATQDRGLWKTSQPPSGEDLHGGNSGIPHRGSKGGAGGRDGGFSPAQTFRATLPW